jgi:adenosylcobyric acid synthase
VLDCLEQLRGTYDAVICEGAGSPAEINLRRTDIVNMGIARGAGLPVLVVGDIDRGGVFASFFGTVALLSREDQECVAGFLVNKFRGDVSLLEPGLDMLQGLTGGVRTASCPSGTGWGSTRRTGCGCHCAGRSGSPSWPRRSARTCCGSPSVPFR